MENGHPRRDVWARHSVAVDLDVPQSRPGHGHNRSVKDCGGRHSDHRGHEAPPQLEGRGLMLPGLGRSEGTSGRGPSRSWGMHRIA